MNAADQAKPDDADAHPLVCAGDFGVRFRGERGGGAGERGPTKKGATIHGGSTKDRAWHGPEASAEEGASIQSHWD
jgi:hypothetical protein